MFACASGGPDPHERAQAYVDNMISHWNEHGAQSALDYYSQPSTLTDGEYYGAILVDGLIAAHALRPEIIGLTTGGAISLDGRPVGPLMYAEGRPEGRWYSYGAPHPTTGELMLKHAWAVEHDGAVFVSGWYEKVKPEGE